MEEKNIHKGHRARMREDFEAVGFKRWHEHQVLEYLLQRCRPRVDTNEIAHRLIEECGGFANVFRAPKEQLEKVVDVGKKTAEYIHMLGEFVRYYNEVRFDVNRRVLDSENCEQYMLSVFEKYEREHFCLICLNQKNEVLFREFIFEGGFENVDIDISKIIRIAVQTDAPNIVLAHNHPSGIAVPSNADIVSTQAIERALRICGIKLLDHIIVAGGKCASMRSGGYLDTPAAAARKRK